MDTCRFFSSATPRPAHAAEFCILYEQKFDFDDEKKLLQDILEKAWQTPTEEWGPHPLFGKLSRKQWGKLAQIHVDYHLRQCTA